MNDRLPIGVTLGPIGVDAAWWLESARRLDDAGYAGLWCWDHFVSRGEKTTPVLEAWTILTAAAAITRRATVGTFVANVTNRHPAVLARMAATLQQVSGGRLVLGIGIGGGPAEHAAYGIPFPAPAERAALLEEAVAVLRALWSGGPATVSGRHSSLADAWAYPLPDPIPPILIGARTPAGVRLAARIGDGWATEADVFEALAPLYVEALGKASRERGTQRVLVGFGSGRAGQDSLSGSPWVADPRAEWERWRSLGADEATVTARTTNDVDALVEAAQRW